MQIISKILQKFLTFNKKSYVPNTNDLWPWLVQSKGAFATKKRA